MKKLLTLVFALALTCTLSAGVMAQESGGMGMDKDKKADKMEKKSEKKEKKAAKKAAKKEKKMEKKEEMKDKQ